MDTINNNSTNIEKDNIINEIESTMPTRMKFSAIGNHLYKYAINNASTDFYKEFFAEDELFELEINVLLFIDYKYIIGEDCYFSTVKDYLEIYCDKKNININIDKLSKQLFYDCFKNKGNILTHNSKLYKSFDFSILEDKLVKQEHRSTYKLSKECNQWLYSSYELETLGNVSIENIILEKEIKSGNFDNTKNTARRIKAILRQEIEDTQQKTRDIYNSSTIELAKDLYDRIEKSIELVKEQQVDIKNISNKIEEIKKGDLSSLNIKEDSIKKGCDSLKETFDILIEISGLQINLIESLTNLRKAYNEVLNDYSFFNNNKYINIGNDVLKYIKLYGNVEFDLLDIFRPMLPMANIRRTNPNIELKKQLIYSKLEEDKSIRLENFDNVEYEDIDYTDIKNENELYEDIFKSIVERIWNNDNKELTILDCFDNNLLLKDSLRELKIVLSILLSQKSFVFTSLDEKSKAFETEYIFDPRFIYPEEKNLKNELEGKRFSSEFIHNENIVLRGTKGDKLILNNIVFTID